MKKWEYTHLTIYDKCMDHKRETFNTLNKLGADGWEVVGTIYNNILILKREKEGEQDGK